VLLKFIKATQTAECEGKSRFLMRVKGAWSQTAAKAGRMTAFIGRLKPPASTVAPAFFSGL